MLTSGDGTEIDELNQLNHSLIRTGSKLLNLTEHKVDWARKHGVTAPLQLFEGPIEQLRLLVDRLTVMASSVDNAEQWQLRHQLIASFHKVFYLLQTLQNHILHAIRQ